MPRSSIFEASLIFRRGSGYVILFGSLQLSSPTPIAIPYPATLRHQRSDGQDPLGASTHSSPLAHRSATVGVSIFGGIDGDVSGCDYFHQTVTVSSGRNRKWLVRIRQRSSGRFAAV